MPKEKRVDVPAIRPQFDESSELAGLPAGGLFDEDFGPVHRGPAWELVVIEAAVEEIDWIEAGYEATRA